MNQTTPPNENASANANANATLSAWQFAGLLIITFLLGLGAGYVIWAYPLQNKLAALEKATPAPAAAAAATTQPKYVRYNVPVDDDPVLGPANAPITLIEFSDYQCPFCRKWQVEVFPKLKEKYGDKIRFVYRDFPLYGNHPEAAPAAQAANCPTASAARHGGKSVSPPGMT